ncbi:T9SS type A sorting domain-containing protein [Flavivirga abyssicola]|uniref:T9SS type A sorting domain-containing protein n=1 Tax=Flavivirga abyssicola TaxID=3063533 RepID=UPI0026DF05E2|nr:T9SS type A sorting domain-containing protein [Flavivirga sp. MEBiC07777]WVK13765.1 T9SS type A sorting domain-containing protein [Flavivirga sp. MEBiC07777]
MKLKLFILLLCLNATIMFAQNESNFYNPNKNGNATVTINNLTGVKSNADSNRLNNAIASLSNTVSPNGKKGGTLTLLPNGGIKTFYLERVNILSNVHLKIDPSITIESVTNSTMIFRIGESAFAENVALTNIDENSNDRSKAFKVRLRAAVNTKEFVVKVGHVTNFKISGIDITDNYTKIAGIGMSTQAQSSDKNKIPRNGVVKNLRIRNAHVGYGLIQAQASKNVYFRNLNGKGGITLRLESGDDPLLKTTGSSIDRVFGRNIVVTNGDAAVNLSPHRSNQGSVDVKGIKAFGSTWAVQCSAGFIGREGTSNGAQDNKGTFSSVKLSISKIVGKANTAQIKSKDFKYFKCDTGQRDGYVAAFTDEVKRTYSSVRGESIGGGRTTASTGCTGGANNGCYATSITFPASSNITGTFQWSGSGTYGNTVPSCSSSSKITSSKETSNTDFDTETETGDNFSIYPNPTSGIVNINTEKGSGINIYNSMGSIVKTIKNTGKSNAINVNNLARGLYIVNTVSPAGKVNTSKLVIK